MIFAVVAAIIYAGVKSTIKVTAKLIFQESEPKINILLSIALVIEQTNLM